MGAVACSGAIVPSGLMNCASGAKNGLRWQYTAGRCVRTRERRWVTRALQKADASTRARAVIRSKTRPASILPSMNAAPSAHDAAQPLTRALSVASASMMERSSNSRAVSYTHLRAHETRHDLVCRLLLEKKKKKRTVVSEI